MSKKHVSFLVVMLFAPLFNGECALAQKVGGLVPITDLGTPTEISKPRLARIGGQLIFSDCPEELTDTTGLPGAMYRDELTGQFRVFLHHQNVTSADISVGLAITNNTRETEILFGRGHGFGINIYPDVAGQTALAEFLSSNSNITLLAILAPGQSYWDTHTIPVGDTGSGILQYVAVTIGGAAEASSLPTSLFENLNAMAQGQDGNPDAQLTLPLGFGLGRAMVTTLAYSGSRPVNSLSLAILPSDGNTRGTFPHYDRAGSFNISASNGIQELFVETSPPGQPYSDDMPGEYELGTDAVDGGIQVYDDGNYGVVYNFQINFLREVSHELPMALMMQPAGGSGHYVMKTDGQLAESPYVDYNSAWWFDELQLRQPSTIVYLATSLTGGSDGPQVLLFDPRFTGN